MGDSWNNDNKSQVGWHVIFCLLFRGRRAWHGGERARARLRLPRALAHLERLHLHRPSLARRGTNLEHAIEIEVWFCCSPWPRVGVPPVQMVTHIRWVQLVQQALGAGHHSVQVEPQRKPKCVLAARWLNGFDFQNCINSALCSQHGTKSFWSMCPSWVHTMKVLMMPSGSTLLTKRNLLT